MNFSFDFNSIVFEDGTSLPARYQRDGENVVISFRLNDGQKGTVTVSPDHPKFADVAKIIAAKSAHGATPEKHFAGSEILGPVWNKRKGPLWRIFFDDTTNRTMIIFPEYPDKAYREMVKEAGFYWSPSTKSWNKKLTHRAYRAAKELHEKMWDYWQKNAA